MDDFFSEDPGHNTPGLWQISAAAKRAGLSQEHFLAGLAAGQIPCAVVMVGRRRFIRVAELESWLAGSAAVKTTQAAQLEGA